MTTNEMVSKMMDQVSAAEAELMFAKTNSGPASAEAKHAADTLTELNKRADALIDTALDQQAAELDGTKAELDKTIELLKHAHSSTNKITIEDPAYNKAVADVQKLQLENDALKSKLDLEKIAAILPPTVSSEVLASAHTPSEPISPNRPAAIKTIWGGLAITVCGLFLIILGKGLKPQTGSLTR
jgi:ABC-type transporter Mla subunit MlaD